MIHVMPVISPRGISLVSLPTVRVLILLVLLLLLLQLRSGKSGNGGYKRKGRGNGNVGREERHGLLEGAEVAIAQRAGFGGG